MTKKKRWLIISILIALAVTIGIVATVVLVNLAGTKQNKHLTDKDFEQLEYVNETLSEIRNNSDYASMDEDGQMQVMLEAIRGLAKSGKINKKSIHVNYEKHYITYQYKCGVLGSESFGGYGKNKFAEGGSHNNTSNSGLEREFYYSDSGSRAEAIILNEVHKTGDDYVKFLTYNKDNAETWTKLGVNTVVDSDVTLDDFANLKGYDMVCIYTHGIAEEFPIQNGTNETIINFTTLFLEQRQTDELNRKYADDLSNYGIITHNGQYSVTPIFFSSHYGSGGLKGRIFFIGACSLMGHDEIDSEAWTTALIENNGVKAFAGFHDTVDGTYSTKFGYCFLTDLIMGKNAKTSFDSAKSQVGNTEAEFLDKVGIDSKDSKAYPLFRGDENARLNLKALPTPTPEPTPTHAPSLNSKVIVEDAYRKEYDYYDSKLVDHYPRIKIAGVNTDAINKKMARELKSNIKKTGENQYEGEAVDYKYYIGEHIVSIRASLNKLEFEHFACKVYNISIATGKEVSSKELLKEYGMTEKSFLNAVKKQYRKFGAGVDHASEARVPPHITVISKPPIPYSKDIKESPNHQMCDLQTCLHPPKDVR